MRRRHIAKQRDGAVAKAFLDKAIGQSGLPEKVVIDKSGANLAGLESVNLSLFLAGYFFLMVDTLQVKYLNNIVEQSHRPIKRKMRQALGLKSIEVAKAIALPLSNFMLWQDDCVWRKESL